MPWEIPLPFLGGAALGVKKSCFIRRRLLMNLGQMPRVRKLEDYLGNLKIETALQFGTRHPSCPAGSTTKRFCSFYLTGNPWIVGVQSILMITPKQIPNRRYKPHVLQG